VSNFFFSLNLRHIKKQIVISFCYSSKYISSIKKERKRERKKNITKTRLLVSATKTTFEWKAGIDKSLERKERACGAVGATSIPSIVGSFSFLTMLFIPTFSQH
jgi:hypothetical protein